MLNNIIKKRHGDSLGPIQTVKPRLQDPADRDVVDECSKESSLRAILPVGRSASAIINLLKNPRGWH